MKFATPFACALVLALSGSVLAGTPTRIVGGGDGDCATQFRNCVASGWPTYKCQQLYDLCISTQNGFAAGTPGDRLRTPY